MPSSRDEPGGIRRAARHRTHAILAHRKQDPRRSVVLVCVPLGVEAKMTAVKPTGVMMVTVQVRDLEFSVAWYRDVLGLTVLWTEPHEFCSLAPFGSTGPAIALATDHPDRIPPTPGLGWTPILTVDDFDSTVAELRARGVDFDAEEEGADEGYRLVRVRDPDGNPIGISASA